MVWVNLSLTSVWVFPVCSPEVPVSVSIVPPVGEVTRDIIAWPNIMVPEGDI